MGILRSDRITGLGGAKAIKGSVKFTSGGALDIDLDGTTIGTSNFTIEAWVYWFGTGAGHQITGSSSNNFNFYLASDDGDLKFYDGSNTYDLDSSNIRPNSWAHVALVREGTSTNQTQIYVNGVNTNQITLATNFSFTRLLSGINYLDGSRGYGHGHTSNLRFTLDTVYTSAFAPKNHELEVLDNTIVLCCQSPGNIFQEATGKKIVVFKHGKDQGDPEASHFAPGSPVGFSTTFGGDYETEDVGTQYGSTFDGFTNFATSTYMVPPGGNTRERGRGRGLLMGGAISPGATNDTTIRYFDIATQGITETFGETTLARRSQSALSSNTRGCVGGGFVAPTSPAHTVSNVIDFVTIATQGNALDFGDMQDTAYAYSTASNQTRGVFTGGYRPNNSAVVNTIDVITIASSGTNAGNFGDLSRQVRAHGGAESTVVGIFFGGTYPAIQDTIDFITIASNGDATDFGNLTDGARDNVQGSSNSTRAVMGGGRTPSNTNIIDYITMTSTGDSTDFGDLTAADYFYTATGNSIRALWIGNSTIGNSMEFVTIATQGNAVDWGDQNGDPNHSAGACSDSHGGLNL